MAELTRSSRKALLGATLALLLSQPAGAQSLYGSIVGTVADPSGAPVPGATVATTNTGTGLKLDVATDASGNYTFRNLLPGVYDLSVSLQGFREVRQTGVRVSAGNPVRIDLKLQVGTVTEALEVTAQSTLLKTEKADLSSELTADAVVNMPLNQYRNYQTLINLVPGATPAQFQNAEIDTPGRSLRTWVNGTQPNSNATRIDGAVSVNIWLPHHVGYIQPAETVETVNVSTNNFDSDQGMAAGAATTVITKSGTNQLRGSAFWFRNQDEFNANSLFNNAFSLQKAPLSRNIYGGTVGGPIVRGKLFFFGSWERFQDRRGFNQTFGVPSLRMRNGDFSEVGAAYSAFRLYDPATGGAGGAGRQQFPGFMIPGNRIDPIARNVLRFYPEPNTTQDLNSNRLPDDYVIPREIQVDRDNYDLKLTWQRSPSHSVWGKLAMLDAEVVDNFILGFDEGSIGDTRVYVGTVGHTWTLGQNLVLDGNLGVNAQNQQVTGPDYGTNIGLDLGIRGSNGLDVRQSGMPHFDNSYGIGTTPNWMPLFRKERSYTFSSALTKLFTRHEVRLGIDVIRHELNHIQAEVGPGVRGRLGFSGLTTGTPGYVPLQWNTFAGFMLGLQTFQGKDLQAEELTGREWQRALYVRDRWNVTQKLTLNLGLRMEHYPLMKRKDRGIERLDYNTFDVLIGGKGGVPEDVGIRMKKLYFAPRLGAVYRLTESSVVRAGYGRTINPLPWSRPMRGSFPLDVYLNNTAEQYGVLGTLADGIPPVPVPDISSGRVKLPVGVQIRSPNPDDVDRAVIQQWNVAFERRLPGNISAEVAYVGTRTDGGYAVLNINHGEPGGGQAARKYFAQAGTTPVNDFAARTRSRYHALQVALNRPFKAGLLLKGAYTLSRARNMASNDEDGGSTLLWNHPLVYDRNFALAGFDRPHVLQMGFVWELPFLKSSKSPLGRVVQGWQLNGVAAAFSGTPYSIGGTNTPLNCQGCGDIQIDVSRDPKPSGKPGSSTDPYYPLEIFSQPVGVSAAGFGNSGRNRFRRPSVWNVDLSLFRTFGQIGRVRPELRIEAANVFNHPNWGAPVTGFTSLNFMRFTPASAENATNTPGPRRVQVGLRMQF